MEDQEQLEMKLRDEDNQTKKQILKRKKSTQSSKPQAKKAKKAVVVVEQPPLTKKPVVVEKEAEAEVVLKSSLCVHTKTKNYLYIIPQSVFADRGELVFLKAFASVDPYNVYKFDGAHDSKYIKACKQLGYEVVNLTDDDELVLLRKTNALKLDSKKEEGGNQASVDYERFKMAINCFGGRPDSFFMKKTTKSRAKQMTNKSVIGAIKRDVAETVPPVSLKK